MKANNINLTFGNEVIFDNAEFNILGNSKVGVVGVNGAGKTTLFKVILKTQELDSGNIILENERIGYLPQEIVLEENDVTVWNYLCSARPIKQLKERLNECYMASSSASASEEKRLLKEAAKIQDTLEFLNEYHAEEELLELIINMDIDEELLEKKVSEISGGQKSKIAFAHLLYSKADILLLDEPTNHLDTKTKEFVINYLKNYAGSFLVISHDISFLNEVVDKILFINKITHKITLYDGNYSDFKRRYALDMARKEARIVEQEREIKKLQEIVRKAESASVTNHNLKRLGKSRQKELDKKLSMLEVRDKEYKKVSLKIEPLREIGNIPLEITNVTFHYPDQKNLYENLNFTLTKNEKFLIVGENGVGKSTLLKLLVNKLTPIAGSIKFSSKADIAYYAQELEILDLNKTILENLTDLGFSERELRTYLGSFLFYGNDVFKKVNVLSPGEKARVALCKTLLKRANFIILDEPTNHFDPDTQELIGENFRNYSGTLLLVSHNPSFVEQIGITRMLVLPEGKILNYSPELLKYYYYLNTDLI